MMIISHTEHFGANANVERECELLSSIIIKASNSVFGIDQTSVTSSWRVIECIDWTSLRLQYRRELAELSSTYHR